MKISRIRIQGFRTIEKVLDCRLQNLTIFTGPNNAGKSGIVRALDLFFNNGGDPTKCLPHVRRNPDTAERQKRFTILITLWFFDLPDDSRIEHEYPGDRGRRERRGPSAGCCERIKWANGLRYEVGSVRQTPA